jgi:hypothetical protein
VHVRARARSATPHLSLHLPPSSCHSYCRHRVHVVAASESSLFTSLQATYTRAYVRVLLRRMFRVGPWLPRYRVEVRLPPPLPSSYTDGPETLTVKRAAAAAIGAVFVVAGWLLR